MAAILIVDSDSRQVEALRGTLEPLGHALILAPSAQEGVEMLRDGGIDMAIVHYTVPVELDVLAKGYERLPDPPPFVLVSSAIDAPSMSAHYGAAEFVAKPWHADELVKIVSRVLEQRATPHEFDESPTRPNEKRGAFE